jgi:hypothetical protein
MHIQAHWIKVVDKGNHTRLLGFITRPPNMPRPMGHQPLHWSQAVFPPTCDMALATERLCKPEVLEVRFEVVWLTDDRNEWLRRGCLSTGASLEHLKFIRTFVLPDETEVEAADRLTRRSYRRLHQ